MKPPVVRGGMPRSRFDRFSRWNGAIAECLLPPVSGALRPPSEAATVGRLALYTRIEFFGRQVGIYNVHLENRASAHPVSGRGSDHQPVLAEITLPRT